MPYLKIFYDSNYNDELDKFDLLPFIDNNLFTSFLDEKYWKYPNDNFKVGENELIQYGEEILKLVDTYKKWVPQINWVKLIFVKKPNYFNVKYFFLLCGSSSYELLLRFVNLNLDELHGITQITHNLERIDDNISNLHENYDELKLLLLQYSLELDNYLDNPNYYSKELDNYISYENLQIIKSFGYFNLKHGDSGRSGLWINE